MSVFYIKVKVLARATMQERTTSRERASGEGSKRKHGDFQISHGGREKSQAYKFSRGLD